jgi:hypothetical protein
MIYFLLLLMHASIFGKCACHENPQLIVPTVVVKPPEAPTTEPIILVEQEAVQAASSQTVAAPVIVPNAYPEPVHAEKEIVPTAQTLVESQVLREPEDAESLRTTVQRAAILCAAIGVVGFILYKATSNSPLERVVSGLEHKARS